MSVIIKRSGTTQIPKECKGGCCTIVHGKNTKKIRRMIKRADERAWRREMEKD